MKLQEKKKIAFFIGIFFKKTDELAFAVEFIQKKIGKYDYFSKQILFNQFPLGEHLNSLFIGDEPPTIHKKYGYKMLSPHKKFHIKDIPKIMKKIYKFQKKLKKIKGIICPILFGYLFDRQIVLVYKNATDLTIADSNGFHSKIELTFSQNSFHNDANTLPLFRREDMIVFFNDLQRLAQVK